MKILARQLAVDMYGCKPDILSTLADAKASIIRSITEANMTLIDSNIQIIGENELTALLLTRQGHITIHSYPNLGYAAVDIYVCSEDASPEKTIKTIKRILKPEKTKTTYLKRGDFGTIKDMKPRIKTHLAPFRKIRNTSAKVINFINKK
jgi:S-adenosylmethionine decarboxylase